MFQDDTPPSFAIAQRRYRTAYDLVLDYATGAAIIGLNPFPSLLWLTLLIVFILLVKLRLDIGTLWSMQRRRGVWAITDILFGLVGALSVAFMAWLTLIIISAFVPLVHRFAISAAVFMLVWMVGLAINNSYLRAASRVQTEEGT